MVNFGARESVPHRFEDRTFVVHNPTVTLMRTTAAENAELGHRIGRKVTDAVGPTAVMLPLEGVSGIDKEGTPFWDPEADAALFNAVRAEFRNSTVELVERELNINDPGFGTEAARLLHSMIQSSTEA